MWPEAYFVDNSIEIKELVFTKELVLLLFLNDWFWTPAWMALVLLFCPM